MIVRVLVFNATPVMGRVLLNLGKFFRGAAAECSFLLQAQKIRKIGYGFNYVSTHLGGVGSSLNCIIRLLASLTNVYPNERQKDKKKVQPYYSVSDWNSISPTYPS